MVDSWLSLTLCGNVQLSDGVAYVEATVAMKSSSSMPSQSGGGLPMFCKNSSLRLCPPFSVLIRFGEVPSSVGEVHSSVACCGTGGGEGVVGEPFCRFST